MAVKYIPPSKNVGDSVHDINDNFESLDNDLVNNKNEINFLTEKSSTTDSAISDLSASLQAVSKEVAEKADSENVYTKKEVENLIPNIDTELNTISTNPVQNKAVAECINHDRGRLIALEARNEFTNEEKSKLAGITNPMVIKGRVDTAENLPASAEIGWFYFVGAEDADYYEEYCYSETGWEYVGLSQEGVDLSNYYTKSEIDYLTMVDSELNTISTNPVQNKAVAKCINDDRKIIVSCKTDIAANTAAITNLQNADMEFSKQIASVNATASIAKSKAEANAEAIADMYTKAEVDELTKVDSELSTLSSSTRPVQNVVVAKAIADDRTSIAACKEGIAINKSTLGYQKKNLFDWKNTTVINSNDSVIFSKTDTSITVTSQKRWARVACKLPSLEVGKKYIFSTLISDLSIDSSAGEKTVRMYLAYDADGMNHIDAHTYINTNQKYTIMFTPTSSTVYLLLYPNFGEPVCTNSYTASEIMLRYADITDDTYEPYVESVDERLNKFEAQPQLYSNTAVSASYLNINIRNLFTNYSAVLCNAVTSSGNYSLILPLKYIKSLGTGTYYTPGNLLFYYVDDNTMEIRTGLGQSNPTISNVKIIGLY